jgi:hypothetical protein
VNNMDHECTHVSKLVSRDEKDTPANNCHVEVHSIDRILMMFVDRTVDRHGI